MKTLEEMLNGEKLKLLHQLFPNEIPMLLDDIIGFCIVFTETHADGHKEAWDFPIYTYEEWAYMARQTRKLIENYRLDMVRSRNVFSSQLSFGYEVIFVIDRIVKYAENRSDNSRFKLAVDMLFCSQ